MQSRKRAGTTCSSSQSGLPASCQDLKLHLQGVLLVLRSAPGPARIQAVEPAVEQEVVHEVHHHLVRMGRKQEEVKVDD